VCLVDLKAGRALYTFRRSVSRAENESTDPSCPLADESAAPDRPVTFNILGKVVKMALEFSHKLACSFDIYESVGAIIK
jgi:hypothetical protein